MESLDAVSSPYVEGILDAAAERTMLLETVRGCLFKCRYCYYPKSHQSLRMLSAAQIDANLRYAIQRAVPEVFFLDPTLNQRPDFHDFLHGLVRANADGQLAFSGELRGEGIDPATARLLRKANFKEVEIGLQSIEPRAQELMGRRTNLKALEAGVRALLDEGIDVQLDMIVGLPGDTADSIRRGLDYLVRVRPFSRVQVFNLSILPGTSFRQDAAALGLEFQPRPPYYVLRTPTLDVEQMRLLMAEAEDAFGIEFDALPPPQLEALGEKTTFRFAAADLSPKRKRGTPPGDPRLRFGLQWGGCMVDLDRPGDVLLPPAAQRAQAFTLWLRSADFPARQRRAAQLIEDLLADNPHTTLQVVLEPRGDPRRLDVAVLETLLEACHTSSSYLDWYYSLHPTGLLGAKRLVVVVPRRHRGQLGRDWIEAVSDVASIVWWGDDHEDEPLEPCEYQIAKLPGIARNFPRP